MYLSVLKAEPDNKAKRIIPEYLRLAIQSCMSLESAVLTLSSHFINLREAKDPLKKVILGSPLVSTNSDSMYKLRETRIAALELFEDFPLQTEQNMFYLIHASYHCGHALNSSAILFLQTTAVCEQTSSPKRKWLNFCG